MAVRYGQIYLSCFLKDRGVLMLDHRKEFTVLRLSKCSILLSF